MNVCADGRELRESDLELARLAPYLFEVRPLRRREMAERSDFRTVRRIEHRGAVAHAAREDVVHRRAMHRLTHGRPPRRAAAAGLDAEQSAVPSRKADRTTA